MKELELRLNAKKSVLSPLQRTTYLGMLWDSTTNMQACFSPARIESILTTVTRVREGLSFTVIQFQKLLGLMAAVSNVIPFGLLYMRPLQWWLKTKGFSPRGNPLCLIKVTRRCLRALNMWRKPWFLSQGPVLGAPCRRVMLATDVSLTGWEAVMSGHPARGLWSGHNLTRHINCLEMLAVFRAIEHFLPDLRDRHVLPRTNNTASFFYVRSAPLIQAGAPDPCVVPGKVPLAGSGLYSWASQYGSRYPVEAGAEARGMEASPRGGEADMESFWPGTDGFFCDSSDIALSPLVLSDSSSSTGAGCYGTDVAKASSVCLSPDRSAPGSSRESAPEWGLAVVSSPVLAGPSMVIGTWSLSSTALYGRFPSEGICSHRQRAWSFISARSYRSCGCGPWGCTTHSLWSLNRGFWDHSPI